MDTFGDTGFGGDVGYGSHSPDGIRSGPERVGSRPLRERGVVRGDPFDEPTGRDEKRRAVAIVGSLDARRTVTMRFASRSTSASMTVARQAGRSASSPRPGQSFASTTSVAPSKDGHIDSAPRTGLSTVGST